MRKKTKKFLEKKYRALALERIAILEEMKKKRPEFAKRYEELIYKLKKKARLLPRNKNT